MFYVSFKSDVPKQIVKWISSISIYLSMKTLFCCFRGFKRRPRTLAFYLTRHTKTTRDHLGIFVGRNRISTTFPPWQANGFKYFTLDIIRTRERRSHLPLESRLNRTYVVYDRIIGSDNLWFNFQVTKQHYSKHSNIIRLAQSILTIYFIRN